MKSTGTTPRRPRLLPLAALLAGALLASQAHAARLGLVVGNDAYQNISKLKNAKNDAQAVARELEAAGFKVQTLFNATRSDFNDGLEAFLRKIEKGDEVVFFFSGHGSQPKGKSAYLLPVDIKQSERSVSADGQSLEQLVAELNARSRFTLAIVDACRDDPFPATVNGRSISTGSNIVVEAPRGAIIFMAASRGQQALDDLGRNDPVKNGLFTRELIKWMKQPGLSAREMLYKVRFGVRDLARTVNHDQWPAITDDASDDFYFYQPGSSGSAGTSRPVTPSRPAPEPIRPAPTPAPAPAPTPAPPSIAPVITPAPAPQQASPSISEAQREYDAWEAAQRSNTRSAIEGFISRFPQGRYVGIARQKLAGMPAAAPAPVAAPKPAAYNPQVEYELWDKADTSKRRADYEAYLAAYPNGRYVDLARAALKTAR